MAVVFQPLREWLQRGVRRLVYGARDELYVLLSGLGQRLEGSLPPEAVLPTVVQTIAEALKLPYVANVLLGMLTLRLIQSRLPVTARQQIARSVFRWRTRTNPLAKLRVAPRTGNRQRQPADRRLCSPTLHAGRAWPRMRCA